MPTYPVIFHGLPLTPPRAFNTPVPETKIEPVSVLKVSDSPPIKREYSSSGDEIKIPSTPNVKIKLEPESTPKLSRTPTPKSTRRVPKTHQVITKNELTPQLRPKQPRLILHLPRNPPKVTKTNYTTPKNRYEWSSLGARNDIRRAELEEEVALGVTPCLGEKGVPNGLHAEGNEEEMRDAGESLMSKRGWRVEEKKMSEGEKWLRNKLWGGKGRSTGVAR